MQIEFRKITKSYGQTLAVADLSLTIESGALHFLLGPSGCGKTTTLRMLAGLEQPSSGSILFGNVDVTQSPAMERGVGMVFQNYALWPHMSVLENVAYGLKIKRLKPAEITKKVNEALAITQLTKLGQRLPGQLSGGQQQRVALARALAVEPNVLLLDEPLSNLDAKLRLEMRDNIARIHRETGITTVYVTHDQKEALSMGTSITVMKDGHLIQTATPRELYDCPESAFIAAFVGETNLLDGAISSVRGDTYEVDTEFGKLRADSCGGALALGTKVSLSIRPEAIHLATESLVSDHNRLDLELAYLTYLGESEQLSLRHPASGQLLRCSLFHNAARRLNRGEKVPLLISQHDVRILPYEPKGLIS